MPRPRLISSHFISGPSISDFCQEYHVDLGKRYGEYGRTMGDTVDQAIAAALRHSDQAMLMEWVVPDRVTFSISPLDDPVADARTSLRCDGTTIEGFPDRTYLHIDFYSEARRIPAGGINLCTTPPLR